MSELRVLRCTRETYSTVASYAGQNKMSLCEALTQIVNGTSGENPPETLPQQQEQATQQEVQEPWKWWRDHYERQRERNAAASAAGQQPTG